MRFACESCSAKYSIADDRVKGRILKIRCKACNHIITVREEDGKSKVGKLPAAPATTAPRERISATQSAIDAAFGPPPQPEESEHTVVSSNPGLLLETHRASTASASASAGGAAAAKAVAPAPALDEWFISFDGDQEGPLSLAKALERVRLEHPKGRECFAWKTGFFVWLPVDEIAEFKDALKPVAKAAVPAMPIGAGAATTSSKPINGQATASAKTVMGVAAPVLPNSNGNGAAASAMPSGVRNGQASFGPSSSGDLPITEASALINLDHLRAAAMAKGANGGSAGPAVGPTSSQDPAAAAAYTPAPVVVVTGPAPRRASGAIKVVAALGVLSALTLGGTLVWVMTQKSNLTTTPLAAEDKGGKKVDDHAISFADPTTTPPTTPTDPKAPVVPKKPNPTTPGTKPANPAATAKNGAGSNLSSQQKGLAALYAEEGSETGAPKGVPTIDRKERGNGQVNQTDILSVVTQNKRSLNMCYERVLKRDNTLKRARVVTQVKVGMSGMVTKVTVPDPQYADSEIGQCLTQAIKKWRFPSSDAEYETEFPILLQAE